MAFSPHSIDNLPIAKVDAGSYEIGSHNVPNASPVHTRKLSDFWIDELPISFAHFELFVAANGYFEDQWWVDSDALPQQKRYRTTVVASAEMLPKLGTYLK